MNCSCAGELELHRPAGAQHGQRDDVLGQHLLLAAEPAADPAANTRTRRAAGRTGGTARRRVRNGTWVLVRRTRRPSSSSQPIARVRLQRGVLHALGREGLPRRRRRAAAKPASTSPTSPCTSATMLRCGSAMRGSRRLVVQHRRARRAWPPPGRTRRAAPRSRRHDAPAARLGGGLGVGHHGGDPLADEAHHVVEHPGVVGIVVADSRAARWRTAVRGASSWVSTAMHARHRQRGRGVDADDPGVGVRRAQQLHVQQAGRRRRRGCSGRCR